MRKNSAKFRDFGTTIYTAKIYALKVVQRIQLFVVVTYDEEKVRLYVYKVCIENYDETEDGYVEKCYFGFSGPQPLDKAQIAFSEELVKYGEEKFDENKVDELIEKFVKEMNED